MFGKINPICEQRTMHPRHSQCKQQQSHKFEGITPLIFPNPNHANGNYILKYILYDLYHAK
jgi:hypothetical protein